MMDTCHLLRDFKLEFKGFLTHWERKAISIEIKENGFHAEKYSQAQEEQVILDILEPVQFKLPLGKKQFEPVCKVQQCVQGHENSH